MWNVFCDLTQVLDEAKEDPDGEGAAWGAHARVCAAPPNSILVVDFSWASFSSDVVGVLQILLSVCVDVSVRECVGDRCLDCQAPAGLPSTSVCTLIWVEASQPHSWLRLCANASLLLEVS